MLEDAESPGGDQHREELDLSLSLEASDGGCAEVRYGRAMFALRIIFVQLKAHRRDKDDGDSCKSGPGDGHLFDEPLLLITRFVPNITSSKSHRHNLHACHCWALIGTT